MTQTILDIPMLRKALNLTQSQLADLAGVNLSTVWRWENGGVPKRGPARAFLNRLSMEAAEGKSSLAIVVVTGGRASTTGLVSP